MNVRWIFVIGLALAVGQVQAQDRGGKRVDLKSPRDKASYSFGMMIGGNLKKQAANAPADIGDICLLPGVAHYVPPAAH